MCHQGSWANVSAHTALGAEPHIPLGVYGNAVDAVVHQTVGRGVGHPGIQGRESTDATKSTEPYILLGVYGN